MANDPLPLPDISAGSPDDPHGGHDSHDAYDTQSAEDAQDAEYEAIHAEIAATERGRWFLSEHVKRNRAADTDRLVDSLARAEAALRGGAVAAMPNPFADDLAQFAAAIGQVEAVIAAGGAPAAGGLAASERIQEIVFALRERETDSCCARRWKAPCSTSAKRSRGMTPRLSARRARPRCCAVSRRASAP
jgi:hypothetical protein